MSQNDLPPREGQASQQQTTHNGHDAPVIPPKPVEAKSAIILLKHARLRTKNEYTQWLLKTMLHPLSEKECDVMNVLYLSKSRKPIWKLDMGPGDPPPPSEADVAHNETFYLSPKTHITTLTYEYRIVYIVDLSSSLATVGSTSPTVLLSGAFESLRNSLEGIVQPFSIPVSAATGKVSIQPILRLTVMADCSQFASNMNIIPMLAEHPTMRVFTQNVIITPENIHRVLAKLHADFMAFQRDTANYRKLLRRKRSKMGYDLDVGSDALMRDVSVLDATSMPSLNEISADVPQSPRISEPTMEDRPPTPESYKVDDTSYHSSKREVWGIGKSGASLSRILHAGFFAFKLLPPEGRPALILITDGIMKSNVQDSTFARQFSEEDVTFHVIQVGSAHSFIPGRNFGFLPDTEILRFLARSTGGTFTYSDQCQRLALTEDDTPPPSAHPRTRTTTSAWSHRRGDSSSTFPEQDTIPIADVVQPLTSDDPDVPPPNMYHRRLLFRECTLSRTESRSTKETDQQPQRYNFPWDPESRPPQEMIRWLRYREYPLPAEFSHIIASRSREGFVLQSVVIDDQKHMTTESSDIGSVKKERIQINMALHWQPNVVIEYRIRATWLPAIIGAKPKSETPWMAGSVFSRAKAPRAEVLVRTDVDFAHSIEQWDAYRRRAQMMGVVTGAALMSEAHTAPAYTKTERLRNCLTDIFEGDESLKTVIGFNSKYLLNLASSGSVAGELAQQRVAFMEKFKEFWNKINAAETRHRTRSWYDHESIDLLVGDVSPYMSPKLTSSYNQDFVANVESEILASLENVQTVLRTWTDFEGEDGTFVRVMNRLGVHGDIKDSDARELFSLGLGYPPSFYEVRVRREYDRLVSLRLLFFNMDVQARHRAEAHIKYLIEHAEEIKAPFNKLCQRPFSRFLMRDPKHFQEKIMPNDTRIAKQTLNARAWYLPMALWLTSEYIVRDYLRHMTWSWQTDNYEDRYHKDNKMMPVHDLAFQFLCQARLDQGYKLVSPRPDSTHFYQEITLPGSGRDEARCAIQYFIWKDAGSGKITTELWMEPSGSLDQYELVKAWTVEPDRKTISQLVTFDQIHAVGRSKGKGDFKKKKGDESSPASHHDVSVSMMLPQLFDVTSVLLSNAFVVASFECPRFVAGDPISLHAQEDAEIQKETVTPVDGAGRYIRRHSLIYFDPTLPLVNPRAAEVTEYNMCLRPDPVLSRNKETIIQLPAVAQNYAILHYFVEHNLETIADGEIIMTHHDVGTSFWLELRKAMKANHFSGLQAVTDLRKMRCFVKVFDVRSFVIILVPSLDTVAAVLGPRTNDPSLDGDEAPHPMETKDLRLDVAMFECVRQKPLKPVKSVYNEAAAEALPQLSVDGEDDIVARPVDWLVHPEGDGLGHTMRPHLLEGYFKSKNVHGQPQVTDRTLRVAQDITRSYARSFFRSFYACLLRGCTVDDEDLGKIMKVCDESTMDIDITEFVNVMSVQQGDTHPSKSCHNDEVKERFASILQHHFEPVKTKSGQPKNLFYYRPSFVNGSTSETTSPVTASPDIQSERIAALVDLVANSQSPLLIRIECQYTKEGTTVTIPTESLPTTFKGRTDAGQDFSMEPEITETWSPLDECETRVALHLVCLSMPRAGDDEEDTHFGQNPNIPFPRESLVNSMRSQPSCFSSLSRDQQEALAETEARIRWLLTEETIHGLLKVAQITKPILQYIERQLGRGSVFVDFPTSLTVPYHFVKDLSDSRLRFMDELEKAGYDPGSYVLRRIDDYFYVSQDAYYNFGAEDALTRLSPPKAPQLEQALGINTSSSASELCNGLGISTIEEHAEGENASEGHVVSATETPEERPLYWLLLVPRERYVQMYIYSKLRLQVDRPEVLKRVKDKLIDIQERTNRLVLLESLQETRYCSKFLEPPPQANMEEDEDSDEEGEMFTVSSNDGSLVFQGKFEQGQYSCPVVLTKSFPLHWRLLPNVALKYLTLDVLRLFIVKNRTNMFVIERDNSIVYCKIFERELDNGEAIPAPTPNTLSLSPQPVTPEVNGKHSPQLEERKASSSSKTTPETKRELVLEVHGLDLPPWIEQEFIGMIENRLVSQITLSEIQQFFLRNPSSRPTEADVSFILPVERPPSSHQVLHVPELVRDPGLLLQFLKQSMLAEGLRLFSGPHVTNAMKRHHATTFNGASCDESELCFYYNCKQRVPGSSSPLELAVGQGMAGIAITLLNTQGEPVNLADMDTAASAMDIDPTRIRRSLEADFKEPDGDAFRVWIDVWSRASADGDVLNQHIYACFRQSLCDYMIEKTVTIDLGAALAGFQRSLPTRRRLGKVLRKKFIESVLYILQKAAEWKSPTVHSFDQATQTMPWCMDDVIDFVDAELCNLDTANKLTVAWAPMTDRTGTAGWELYKGQTSMRQKVQSNIRIVGISGLTEFVEKLGTVVEQAPGRRTSTTSDRSRLSRRSSADSKRDDRSRSSSTSQAPSTTTKLRNASLASSSVLSKPETDKHSFLIMTMDVNHVAVSTYNWTEKTSFGIFDGIFRVATRQEARNHVLNNILHQKLGLFHHTLPMQHILESHETQLNTPPQHPSCQTHTRTPHLVTSPKHSIKSRTETKGTETTPSSHRSSRRHTNSSMSLASSVFELRDMILYPTVPEKSDASVAPSTDDEYRQLSGQAGEIDHTLVDETTDPDSRKEYDLLRRHGLPFLDALVRRTRMHTLQAKARSVYEKWNKRYGDVQVDTSGEKLTRYEVTAILRTSRLLHYCRTPLLFSKFDTTWPSVENDPVLRDTAIQWFERLMDTILSEYETYLKGVEMRPIDIDDDSNTTPSMFRVAKCIAIPSRSRYLLRVVEGGSIICEVRLTGINFSVTLYTLHHRSYGRRLLGDKGSFEKRQRRFKRFEALSARFKQYIHVRSFVYDFHLRYVQKLLEEQDMVPLPPEFNLITVIRQFGQIHTQPASYARNRFMHGFYEFEINTGREAFFESLMRNFPKHGLVNVVASNAAIGATATSRDLSFENGAGPDASEWKHTLLVCPALEQDAENNGNVLLEYFVLTVHQGACSPMSASKSKQGSSDPANQALLASEGYTMEDVMKSVCNRLDQIVSEVIVHCRLANTWRELYNAADPVSLGERLPSLLSDFDRLELGDVDPRLGELLRQRLNWQTTLNTLAVFGQRSGTLRDFVDPKNNKRHLLLYNTRYMDYMIHLELTQSQSLQGWVVSRERRKDKTRVQGAEREQMANLGGMLCHILWLNVKGEGYNGSDTGAPSSSPSL